MDIGQSSYLPPAIYARAPSFEAVGPGGHEPAADDAASLALRARPAGATARADGAAAAAVVWVGLQAQVLCDAVVVAV